MPKARTAIDAITIRILTFALLIVLPIAPAAGADSTKILWEDKDEFVRIEPVDDPTAAPNSHPVQLPPAQLKNMLSTLRVNIADSEDQPPLPVFSNPELERLGEYLSRGLTQAGPGQDVTFAVMGTRSVTTGGFFRKRLMNTGRVFYADGNLNVIFGEILGSVKKKNVYGRRDQNFDRRHYGLRTEPRQHDWELLTGPGLALHGAGNHQRGDWVLIDLEAAPDREASREVTPPQPPPQPATAAVATPAAPQTPPAVEPAAPGAEPATPSARPAPRPAEPPGPAEAPAKPATDGPDIEQRLKTLKDLRDKGLITEEAYEAKMQEILKEL